MRNRSCRIRHCPDSVRRGTARFADIADSQCGIEHVQKFCSKRPFALPSLVTNDRARLSMGLTVIKRDGREEPVAFDKITARINKLAYGLNQDHCDPVRPSVFQISRMPPDSKKPALFPRLARPPLTPRDAPRRTSRAAPTSRILPRNDPPGPRDTTPERVADRPKTASRSPLVLPLILFFRA